MAPRSRRTAGSRQPQGRLGSGRPPDILAHPDTSRNGRVIHL